jgi:rhodanese-related sulfurtransferase
LRTARFCLPFANIKESRMPIRIDHDEVGRLIGDGAQIVDVLPADDYAREHIRGAINIPLTTLNAETTAGLERSGPLIVYCFDTQCDLSPRAAERLETLGFHPVFDYTVGLQDWLAFDLPTEGTEAGRLRAGKACRRDVPVCRITDRMEDVQFRVRSAEWDTCIVITDDGVVLGRISRDALRGGGDPDVLAGGVMEEGPNTVRPNENLDELVERMDKHGVERMLVATSAGTLIGEIKLAEAKLALDGENATEEQEKHVA